MLMLDKHMLKVLWSRFYDICLQSAGCSVFMQLWTIFHSRYILLCNLKLMKWASTNVEQLNQSVNLLKVIFNCITFTET